MAELFKVRSRQERGRWRSGRFFSRDWVDVAADEMTDAILADPLLEVELVEVVTDEAVAECYSAAGAGRGAVRKKGGRGR